MLKTPYFYLIKQLSTLIKIQRKNTKVVKANLDIWDKLVRYNIEIKLNN